MRRKKETLMSKTEDKLNAIYAYVKEYIEQNGYAPAVRDICRDLNIKSTATAHSYLARLSDRGLIVKAGEKKRAIGLKSSTESFSVPVIGVVTAGTPILAVENFEDYYPVPKEFYTGEETFILRVRGESMINAGILDGDKIIVKKSETASNGDICVALIDDSATVKRFFKRNGKIILHPENDFMDDIVLDDVKILGLVTGLIRKF